MLHPTRQFLEHSSPTCRVACAASESPQAADAPADKHRAAGVVQRAAARDGSGMATADLLIERSETADPEAREADSRRDRRLQRRRAPAGRIRRGRSRSSRAIGTVWSRAGCGVSATGTGCIVDLLFLPEDMRGSGMGRRVMRAAEREAALRGCRGIWLDTMTFQAPDFYRKLGFSVFGEIRELRPRPRADVAPQGADDRVARRPRP